MTHFRHAASCVTQTNHDPTIGIAGIGVKFRPSLGCHNPLDGSQSLPPPLPDRNSQNGHTTCNFLMSTAQSGASPFFIDIAMPSLTTYSYPQLCRKLRCKTGISLLVCGLSLVTCCSGTAKPEAAFGQRQPVAAVEADSPRGDDPIPSTRRRLQWRRTTAGWEPTVAWQGRGPQLGPTPTAARVHPAIIATLQVLVSIGALLVFEYSDEDESTDLVHMLTER